jgi:2-keto-3-deoxy-L-rhamnonate aldolase RhmA
VALTTLKEMAGTRRAKFGTFLIELASPGIGHILKAGGAQYVFIDMEHSGFGFDTLKQLLRYMEAAELPAIVRVPSRHYHHIARALDMGAEGIMLPMVGTAAEAARIAGHAKYPPLGKRGVALGVAHDRYAPGAPASKMRSANSRVAVFLLVETRQGVENAEEIAATDGIDGLWIGHVDLSTSLGIPGRFDHPDFTEAVAQVARACARHRKSFGRLVPDVESGIAAYHAGFDMICYSGDVWLLRETLGRGIDDLKAALRARRRG